MLCPYQPSAHSGADFRSVTLDRRQEIRTKPDILYDFLSPSIMTPVFESETL